MKSAKFSALLQRIKAKNLYGFSLIELSALLVVMGLAMSTIISIKTSEVDRDTRVTSKSNIDEVYAALNAYAGRNGRLPCVASRTLASSNANFAREVMVDCTADTSTPAGTARFETVASSGVWVREGAVPVYDLLLPESAMFDEYGNRYSYAVIENLTEGLSYAAASGALIVKDAAGADIATNAAFVVYSHGKDGKGAYRGSSGSLKVACGATTNLDVENCDGDAIFRKADISETQTAALFYDDLFRYGTKPVTSDGGGGGGPIPPDFTGFRANGILGVGQAVASGDINGDGFDDVIIGAHYSNSNGGAAYVIFGKASGIATPLDLSTSLDGTNGFKLDGSAAELAGYAVSSGDINGDGFDDVIIGAIYASSNRGFTYVVFGKASGWAATTALSSLNGTTGFKLYGENNGDRLGNAISSGNINNDGFDDVISCAYFANSETGYCYVVFGKASGWAAVEYTSSLNGTTGFRLDGTTASDYAGYSVAIGNINNDAYDDIIIGAYGADYGASTSGSTYVVFGKASGWAATTALSSLNGTTGFRLDSIGVSDVSGYAVASGDINNDGFDDVIISVPYADYDFGAGWQMSIGSINVVFGKASGWAATMTINSLNGTNGFRAIGKAVYDGTSDSLAVGDINDDNYDDIIIGTPHGYGSDSGYVHVLFGKSSGWNANEFLSNLDGSNGFRLEGTLGTNDYVGNSVAVGDITGDGIDDVIIGAITSNRTYGVYGKAGAWSATYDLDTITVP